MSAPSDAEIIDRAREILSREEFQPPTPEPWEKIGAMLRHFFERLTPIERWGLIALCVVLLAAIATHLVLTFRLALVPDSSGSAQEPGSPRAIPTVEGTLALARRLAIENRLREAARALQDALLLSESQRKGIPWQPALSDAEWLTVLEAPEPIIAFTQTTQRLAYGPDPSPASFDDALRRLRQLTETAR